MPHSNPARWHRLEAVQLLVLAVVQVPLLLLRALALELAPASQSRQHLQLHQRHTSPTS